MGLEEVKKDIIEAAEKEAAEIMDQATKEADRLKAAAEKDAEGLGTEAEMTTTKYLEGLERKEVALAKLEAKKYLFEKKKNLINIVISDARKRIVGASMNEKKVLLKKILTTAGKEIELCNVYCNKTEMPTIKKLITSKTKVSPIDISGGLIVENKDKTTRIDYSYDSQLEEIYENRLQELAQLLF